MASDDCVMFWSWLSRGVFNVPARAVRVRLLDAAPDGEGVDGPVDSAAITACLRFVPVDSGIKGEVIAVKLGSVGGGMRATVASPVLGKRVADKGAAGGTIDSLALALVTENRRDLDGR